MSADMRWRSYIPLRSQAAPSGPEDTEALRQMTRRLSIKEGAVWSIMWGFGESYISLFAIFLGAGARALAVLGTMPSIVGAVGQLAGASLVDRLGRRRGLIATTSYVHAFAYLALFLAPLILRRVDIPMVLAASAAIYLMANVQAPAWNSLMGDVVPDGERGRYFARRNQIVVAAMLVSLFAAAHLLDVFDDRGQAWTGYGLLFAAACAARCASAAMLRRHCDPPLHVSREAYFSFWDFVRRTRHSNFARFTFAIALMNAATNVAGPFFALYMKRDLHWDYVWISMTTVTYLLAQILSVRWWGRLCDRHGARKTLLASGAVLPVLPIVWAMTGSYPALLLVQMLSGAAWAGFTLSVSNFTYDAVTPPKRARAFGYHNVVNGLLSLGAATIVGAFFAENAPSSVALGPIRIVFVSSLPFVFIVSGLLRVLVLVLMFPLFREVRAAEPISTVRILWRFGTGEPVLEQLLPVFSRLASPARKRERKA